MEFRERLRDCLNATEIQIVEVPYDDTAIINFNACCVYINKLLSKKRFEDMIKKPSKLCDWCQYKEYCQSDGKINYMIL